jgi:G:T/U-mismatch repair DNA glycosylase
MLLTQHAYISKYPIPITAQKLILGTIHPHDRSNFLVDFFYGNKASLWKILHHVFPGELIDPLSLQHILTFLSARNIAVADTIAVCKRHNPTALDKDLIPIQLNTGLIDAIKNSDITEILCTSGFAKNNAFRLFYCNMLSQKITPQIKKDRQLILPPGFFGREIKIKVLYSPAGTANTGLAKSNAYLAVKHLYHYSKTPVSAFKINYYRSNFSANR